MFTAQQFGTLLKMQNDMQCAQLGDDWVTATAHNYGRAIAVEACEAMDHVGFKWWKDKEPDMEQVKMELVDILHFELCWGLQQGATHTDRSATMSAAEMLCEDFDEIVISQFTKDNLLDVLGEIAIVGIRSEGVMYDLMYAFKLCGLTGDDVFKLYIGKNVLNRFRKNNGYKEGSYIKQWGDAEDNVTLTKILNSLPLDKPEEFEELLYGALDAEYDHVLKLHGRYKSY